MATRWRWNGTVLPCDDSLLPYKCGIWQRVAVSWSLRVTIVTPARHDLASCCHDPSLNLGHVIPLTFRGRFVALVGQMLTPSGHELVTCCRALMTGDSAWQQVVVSWPLNDTLWPRNGHPVPRRHAVSYVLATRGRFVAAGCHMLATRCH